MGYLIQNAAGIFSTAAPGSTDLRISGGTITEIGTGLRPAEDHPEETIDARGCIVWPGLVNTHYHLAQSLLKGVPAGLNQDLGERAGRTRAHPAGATRCFAAT